MGFAEILDGFDARFLQETTRRMENVRHFLKNASFLILTDGDEIGAAIFTE